MFNVDQLMVLAAVVVGIIVLAFALLVSGGYVKGALVFTSGLVLGVATLMVTRPNAFSILIAFAFIVAGVWLMNIIRIREDHKKSQKQ